MSKVSLLHLQLEAPLQSWGIRSNWYHRDTIRDPTKSGIIGLLSAALGLERNDAEIEKLNVLKMGVRAEREGDYMIDYQTISGGYYSADHKYIPDGVIVNKEYLESAFFLILLSGPQQMLNMLKKALEKPKFTLSLGRKSCIPSSRVYAGLSNNYSSIKEALEKVPWSLEWRLEYPKYFVINEIPDKLRCLMDDPEGNIKRNDVRLFSNKAKIRKFKSRRVLEFYVKTPLESITIEEDLNVSV